MEKLNIEDFIKNHDKYIYESIPPVSICAVAENTLLIYGRDEYIDEQYCKDNNIATFKGQDTPGAGGAVYAKGNIMYVSIVDVSKGWQGMNLLNVLCDYFKLKGLNAEINHNDLMIDGYKTCSFIEHRMEKNENNVFTAFQISINQEYETIEKACTKKSLKEPKALSDYGITTEEIVDLLQEYSDKNITNETINEDSE